MKTWDKYIEELKEKHVGKKVIYDDRQYTIVDVDYNGVLHIDRQTRFNDTTAVQGFNLKWVTKK